MYIEMIPSFGIIYVAKLKIDGRKYYGKTTQTLNRRKSRHIFESRKPSPNYYFHRALKFHGIENFGWEIIETCPITELSNRERFYIARDQTIDQNFGFNLTHGGEGNDGNDIIRAKISQAYKRRVKVFQFDLDQHFLREFESLKDATTWLKSQPGLSKAYIAGVLNVKRSHGYIWSRSRTIDQIELSRISKPTITEERNAKISLRLKGRKFTQQWVRKISKGRKGIPMPADAKQLLSKRMTELWKTKWMNRRSQRKRNA